MLINIYLQTSYDCRPFCHVNTLIWGIIVLFSCFFIYILFADEHYGR